MWSAVLWYGGATEVTVAISRLGPFFVGFRVVLFLRVVLFRQQTNQRS